MAETLMVQVDWLRVAVTAIGIGLTIWLSQRKRGRQRTTWMAGGLIITPVAVVLVSLL